MGENVSQLRCERSRALQVKICTSHQGSCDAEAFNATLHPFIRNTVGSMDFGGSALNKFYNYKNRTQPRAADA